MAADYTTVTATNASHVPGWIEGDASRLSEVKSLLAKMLERIRGEQLGA